MKEAACPECGAMIQIASPGSVLLVCPYCQSASYRRDRALELFGKVAERAPLASHFQIGTTGLWGGSSFTVRGQIQLDHGLGLWNEWAVEDEEGAWCFIAEAQGELWLTKEAPLEAAPPPPEELVPGARVELGPAGIFMVVERGRGRVVSAAGELPLPIPLGTQTSYVDLEQGENQVATLDYTRQQAELFLGRRLAVQALELDPETQPEHRPEKVTAREIRCAHCGAPIVVRDPEQARRVGCASCGTLLDVGSEAVRAIEMEAGVRRRPALPLGQKGNLRGEAVEILAYLERYVMAEGVRYPWREYLLRTDLGAFRWLVESDGHWIFMRKVSPAALEPLGFSLGPQLGAGDQGRGVRFRGRRFKPFSSGLARVSGVLGEVYWDVAVDEEVMTADLVAPPRSISLEADENALHASLGDSVSRSELARAFQWTKPLPAPDGVGMVARNPYQPLGRWWGLYGLALLLLIGCRIYFGFTDQQRVVLKQHLGPVPVRAIGDAGVELSPPFELWPDPGNLQVRLEVPGVRNGWVGVDGSLVNLKSGEVTTFGISAEHWSGRSSDGPWSEGQRTRTLLLGPLKRGSYRLRLAASGERGGLRQPYWITLTSQVPNTGRLLLAALLLALMPAGASLLALFFEGRRWQKSDHPWSSQS